MDNFSVKILWLWLILKQKINKKKLLKLYGYFESIEEIYKADRYAYENLDFLKSKDIDLLCDKSLKSAEDYLILLCERQTDIITVDSPFYPKALFDLEDAPLALHYRGKLIDMNKEISISVVGTRHPTAYGENLTNKICRRIASHGIVIVSGLAMGVDALSHNASISCNIPTVAVLGCGADVIYPKCNKDIYNNILKNGMIISEYLLGTTAERYNFPARNRIIASLSCAVAVTEASEKSGSLITAKYAHDLGRKIFALPGNVNSSNSIGTNTLLSTGSYIMTDGDEIIDYCISVYGEDKIKKLPHPQTEYEEYEEHEEEKLKNEVKDTPVKIPELKDDNEIKIVQAIKDTPLTPDEIYYKTGISITELNYKLLMMEVRGIIKKTGPNSYKAL